MVLFSPIDFFYRASWYIVLVVCMYSGVACSPYGATNPTRPNSIPSPPISGPRSRSSKTARIKCHAIPSSCTTINCRASSHLIQEPPSASGTMAPHEPPHKQALRFALDVANGRHALSKLVPLVLWLADAVLCGLVIWKVPCTF